MDLDKALLYAIMSDPVKNARLLRDRAVSEDMLFGEGKVGIEFFTDYVRRYGEFPTQEIVEGKLGIQLDTGTPVPAEFLIDEIFKRRLYYGLKAGLDSCYKLLEAQDPEGAYTEFSELFRLLRKQATTTGGDRPESLTSLGSEVLEEYDRIKGGETGILTPWQGINSVTSGFWAQDLVLFVARMSTGKCLHEDSLIMDPKTGCLNTIKEVVSNPALNSVLTWNKEKGIHTEGITRKVDNKTKRCIEITLRSGKKIIVTPEHPLLTPSGWLPAKDVQKNGGSIATPSSVPFPTSTVSMPKWKVELIALLLAEGTYTGNHVGFSTADPEIIKIGNKAAEKLGISLKHYGKYDYDFVGDKGTKNPVRELLKELGIDNTLAINKTIPKEIFALPKEDLCHFLTVFWMCDGGIDKSGPSVTLGSEKMIDQLQHLLLRLGVTSSKQWKRTKYKGEVRHYARLNVTIGYNGNARRFSDSLHLWGQKKERLEAILLRGRDHSDIGFPVLNAELAQSVTKSMKTMPNRTAVLKHAASQVGRTSVMRPDHIMRSPKNTLNLRSFQELTKHTESLTEYKWLTNSGLYWDQIESVKDAGMCHVYDLTVAPTSCFVANDMVVHNSWMLTLLSHFMWQSGKRVLFATTEMSKRTIARRWYGIHCKVPYREFKNSQLSIYQEEAIRAEYERIKEDDRIQVVGGDFDFTMDNLEAAVDDTSPDVLFVDGAYLLKTAGFDRRERSANAFDELKRLANRKKIPIILTLQFNREVKGNSADTVQASSIAQTDVAGWNADVIYGMWQSDDMKLDKRMRLINLKTREGAGTDVEIRWDLDRMEFGEIPQITDGGGGGEADEYGTGIDPSVDTSDLPF